MGKQETNEQKIKELKKTIQDLNKKCDEYLNGWKRAKADYLNLEKEMLRQKEEWIRFSNGELISQLIPVLDSFDKAISHLSPEDHSHSWAKGLLNMKNQLENILRNAGLEKIKAKGEKFNPDFHEAIKKEGKGDKIVEEVQTGYLFQGRLLRPAKVIIK